MPGLKKREMLNQIERSWLTNRKSRDYDVQCSDISRCSAASSFSTRISAVSVLDQITQRITGMTRSLQYCDVFGAIPGEINNLRSEFFAF